MWAQKPVLTARCVALAQSLYRQLYILLRSRLAADLKNPEIQCDGGGWRLEGAIEVLLLFCENGINRYIKQQQYKFVILTSGSGLALDWHCTALALGCTSDAAGQMENRNITFATIGSR
jgi:hypothetical protein